MSKIEQWMPRFAASVSILTPVRIRAWSGTTPEEMLPLGYLIETSAIDHRDYFLRCVRYESTEDIFLNILICEFFVDGKWLTWDDIMKLGKKIFDKENKK